MNYKKIVSDDNILNLKVGELYHIRCKHGKDVWWRGYSKHTIYGIQNTSFNVPNNSIVLILNSKILKDHISLDGCSYIDCYEITGYYKNKIGIIVLCAGDYYFQYSEVDE